MYLPRMTKIRYNKTLYSAEHRQQIVILPRRDSTLLLAGYTIPVAWPADALFMLIESLPAALAVGRIAGGGRRITMRNDAD